MFIPTHYEIINTCVLSKSPISNAFGSQINNN